MDMSRMEEIFAIETDIRGLLYRPPSMACDIHTAVAYFNTLRGYKCRADHNHSLSIVQNKVVATYYLITV